MDTGDIYFKEPIDISIGNADEIFEKISEAVFSRMIPQFITGNITLKPQQGQAVVFPRRRPEESEIPEGLSQRQIYDYIRMLDGGVSAGIYKMPKWKSILQKCKADR